MSLKMKLAKALFGATAEGDDYEAIPDAEVAQVVRTLFAEDDGAPADPPAARTPGPATFAESAEFRSMQATIDALRDKGLKADADGWADGLVRERRATPAQRATLAALFTRASRDDAAASATVTFSAADGTPAEGGRLDALKALFALAPTDAERFAGFAEGKAVFAADSVATTPNPADRPANPENVKRLAAMAGIAD